MKKYFHKGSSVSHHEEFGIWKLSERTVVQLTVVQFELHKQIQRNKRKWRDILARLLDRIKYLASQNLVLRGHDEKLSETESHNPGNLFGAVEPLAKYDPLLNSHLCYIRSTHSRYSLSHTAC